MKRILLNMCMLLQIFLFISVGLNAQDWEWKNPLPQGNRINDVYAFNNSEAIAVGATGLVFKTTNGGANWSVSKLKTSEWLYAVHFADATVGYIAYADGNISKTTDGGETWTLVTKPTSSGIYDIWTLSSSNVVCVSYDGAIYKTTDGGSTWVKKINPGTGSAYLNDLYFIDSNVGFIVGGNSYTTPARSEIFKTTDGGDTWDLITSPIESALTSICFIDANTGFIVGENGAILKSVDAGENWSLYSNSGDNYSEYTSGAIYTKFSTVTFFDENNGIAAGEAKIYYTSNGGTSWTQGYHKYGDNIRTVFINGTSSAIALGDNGAIIKSSNKGHTWVKENDYNTNSFYGLSFSGPVGYAVATGGNVLKSTDNGETWVNLEQTGDYRAALTLSDKDAIIAGSSVFVTSDGGASWSYKSIDGSGTIRGLHSPKSSNLVYGVGSNRVIKSTDNGATWANLTSPYSETLNEVCFINDKTGVAVGGKYGEGKIFRTTDGASSWQEITSPATGSRLYGIDFITETKGFACGEDTTLIKTIDGGLSWTKVILDSDLPSFSDDLYEIKFGDESNGVVVGVTGIVYVTSNGGETWTIDNTVPTQKFFYACDYSLSKIVVAGSDGAVLAKDVTLTVTETKPTLTTTTITNITQTTATSGGNITDNGGADVTARGVCWSTSPAPTITDSKTEDGAGAGEFTSNLTGLTANTTYYVRAYATNSAGTGYGNEVVFTTSSIDPFTEPEWVHLNYENVGIRSNAAQQDSKGNMWFAGQGAITKYTTEGQVIEYKPTSGNIGTDYFVLENDNAMWTGNYVFGVSKFDGNGNWIHYNEENSGLPTNYIYSIAVDSKGNKWIATNGKGLAMFDDTNWTVYTKENSDLPANTIYSIFIDKNDNIWLGFAQKLAKFDGTTWSVYDYSNITTGNLMGVIKAISIDNNDNIWIGGGDAYQGVATASLSDLTVWTNYKSSNSDYPISETLSIAFDKDGRTWFGTWDKGVVIFDGASWYNYNNGNSNWPSTHRTTSIFRDLSGNTWLSCEYGVVLVGEYVPTVSTVDASDITQTSALSGGTINFYGGADITTKGVVWSKTTNPTLGTNDGHTDNGTGTTGFTSNLTGLTANTTYYVRAYATNSAGTGYGNEVEFTTSPAPVVPTLTTTVTNNITQTTATSGGNITDNGGADVTARGVCWSTTQNPTVADSKTEDGTGVGEFTSNLTGLTANTKYYVRAYATNSAGTGYGNEVEFTTEEETSVDPLPLPFIENFDGELHKWIVIDGDEDGNKWGIYQNSSEVEIAYSGTKCAGVKYNTSGNNDWLITPLLTLPAGEEIEFSFWAKSQDPAYLESFDIQISTDEGVSFTKIGYETDISASYTKYSYDLSGYAGQNVHIAIVCVSVNKFFLYVDDISCATKESTYSPIIPLEFNIIAYPNPFTNNLTIESDKGIRRIVITNINGQVVIQKHINGEISKQINTQKLGSGLYLLQVIDINRKSTHIKLVKP